MCLCVHLCARGHAGVCVCVCVCIHEAGRGGRGFSLVCPGQRSHGFEYFGSLEPHVLGSCGEMGEYFFVEHASLQTFSGSPQPLLSPEFTPFSA